VLFPAVESSFMALGAGDERFRVIHEVCAWRGSPPSLPPMESSREAETKQWAQNSREMAILGAIGLKAQALGWV